MSPQDLSDDLTPLEHFDVLDNMRPRSSDDYRYNYSYVAPLALLHVVPRPDKPSLAWMQRVVWQSLRIAKNRLHWALNTGRAVRPGDELLTFSGDDEEPGSITLNLDHLGLPELDLINASFEEEFVPTNATRKGQDPSIGEEIVSFSHEHDTIREGFTPRVLATEIATKLISFGVTHPFDILETILRSLLDGPSGRPMSLDDYHELFATLPKPWIADRWDDDETFAWLRVAGWNPLIIKRISSVPEHFPVTREMFARAMDNDTLDAAAAEGRLYLTDYAMLADVVNGSFPSGPKYCFAPLALFALPRGEGKRRLRPIAIQCGQDSSDYRIFTPADGEMWTKAKLCLTVADTNHQALVGHLAHTHFLIEPIAIATHRVLTDAHPIGKLLIPHLEGTLSINDAAQSKLIRRGFSIDRLLAGTVEASRAITVQSVSSPHFNEGFLPKSLAARDVLDEDLEYPYRDDALLVWNAIHQWISSYVRHHYASDAHVEDDLQLAMWGAEVVAKDGGRLLGFGEDGAGKLTTLAYLIDALTMILFTASAQHAAMSFPQFELMAFAPAAPLAAYRSAPLSKSESARNPILDMFAPMEIAMLQVEAGALLGGVHHTRLGAYPPVWFTDPAIAEALQRFQQELVLIGKMIEERNRSRFGPYPFFMPERIPQSINI